MSPGNHIPLCTIAGSDPTGGAGLQGDLKTFAAHGVTGTAVVTALTVQGRRGVSRVEPVAADLVAEQLEVVREEVRPAAWKTGMLWDGAVIRAVARALSPSDRRGRLVVDPVLVATAGGDLLRPDALDALRAELLPIADVITPNLHEGARLLGRGNIEDEQMEDAARALLETGAGAVVLKGGDAEGPEAVDVLAVGDAVTSFRRPRLDANAHGTGCAFAASLAARLARGQPLADAVAGAKDYVHRALAAGAARGREAHLVHAVAA
jgi:hydroxymethylpyrimidine/phosphomethylpyrimidine kinase